MPSAEVEHYATLFDTHFLLQGLCLHASLRRSAQPFKLWVLCMDEAVERHLLTLALPDVALIPLRELEDSRLLAVKAGRSRGEYCWTLTPFLIPAVFARDPSVPRATYLDADLYFFSSPAPFFQEFEDSGKSALITEHAFAPEYDKSADCGRFCVQFLTFTRSDQARAIWTWWQDRCLEWCFGRVEDGKFGDQKYLDQWPTMFRDDVHILSQSQRTLAPWNANHVARSTSGRIDPVFFHFHGLRPMGKERIMLWNWDYHIASEARWMYRAYLESYREAVQRVAAAGIRLPPSSNPARNLRERWRVLRMRVTERSAFARVPGLP